MYVCIYIYIYIYQVLLLLLLNILLYTYGPPWPGARPGRRRQRGRPPFLEPKWLRIYNYVIRNCRYGYEMAVMAKHGLEWPLWLRMATEWHRWLCYNIIYYYLIYVAWKWPLVRSSLARDKRAEAKILRSKQEGKVNRGQTMFVRVILAQGPC